MYFLKIFNFSFNGWNILMPDLLCVSNILSLLAASFFHQLETFWLVGWFGWLLLITSFRRDWYTCFMLNQEIRSRFIYSGD